MLIETGGEFVAVQSELPWAGRIIARGTGGATAANAVAPTVRIAVDADRDAFGTSGLRSITRGAWSDGMRTVLANAGGSGFDLQVSHAVDVLEIDARYRPGISLRVANRVLSSRFELLATQVLVHYPALWRASWRGRVPLHASVLATNSGTPLLAGPGGVGKSTVLTAARRKGATTIGDNLCTSDGGPCFGVAEPLRTDARSGSESGPVGAEHGVKTSHGRVSQPFGTRLTELKPDRVVVLERGPVTDIELITPQEAARTLIAGTYAAGELRRYWAFAATLCLATGLGPAHPPIDDVAATLTGTVPCLRVRIGDGQSVSVEELCGVDAIAKKGTRR